MRGYSTRGLLSPKNRLPQPAPAVRLGRGASRIIKYLILTPVARADLSWLRPFYENLPHNVLNGAIRGGSPSRSSIHGNEDDTWWGDELLIIPHRLEALHVFSPYRRRRPSSGDTGGAIVAKTEPHAGDEIGGKSDEPSVAGIV